MKAKLTLQGLRKRRLVLMLLLFVGLVVLLLRSVWLEVFDQSWLKERADKRQVREVVIPPYRGMILDRSGEPVAVSSPVRDLSCNPRVLLAKMRSLDDKVKEGGISVEELKSAQNRQIEFAGKLSALADELGMHEDVLLGKLNKYANKHYMQLARQVEPELAERVLSLDLPSVSEKLRYRRFYPGSETFSHVVGVTDISGKGVEGIELFQNEYLSGKEGRHRVVKDRSGRFIEVLDIIEEMIPGRDVKLSIDRRIQYVAYRELKKQVYRLKAQAGSVVVIDVKTGEILAMANMPGFNPNNRKTLKPRNMRNRAVMDILEMGSTMKPFTIAAALDSKVVALDEAIDTSPGYIDFGDYKVKDPADLGVLSLRRIIQRSSNVGASKLALRMDARKYWMFLDRIGMGRLTNTGLKNERVGYLANYKKWERVDQAVMSYGYGLSSSLLQMAHAYTIFGSGGILRPVTIMKRDKFVGGQRVLSESIANQVLLMMESVVSRKGTAIAAAVDGYRVAGKTGTAYKLINKKYRKDKRITSFIGLGPVSNPKVVVAVMIDQPKLEATGGRAAAPVFSKIMAQTLRVMDAAPDKSLYNNKSASLKKSERLMEAAL